MSVKWDVKRSDLDPEFNADVNGLLEALPDSWCVTFGRRSFAVQKALYEKHLAGGPLAAPPGHSPHEHGEAVDAARIDEDGKLSWDTSHPAWPRLWAAIKAHPRLHSGHDFPPVAPADDDHIQSVKWYKIRAALKLKGEW